MKFFKHQFVLALLGLSIAVWTLVSFQGESLYGSFLQAPLGFNVESLEHVSLLQEDQESTLEIPFEELVDNDFVVETGEAAGTVITFPGKIILRVQPTTSLTLRQSSEDGHFSVELKNGRIWVNTLFAEQRFFVRSHEFFVDPPPFGGASFAISASQDHVSVIVLKNAVSVNFPGGNGVVFVRQAARYAFRQLDGKQPESILEPRLEYESLKFSDVKDHQWFQENLQRDEQFRQVLIQRVINTIRQRGLVMARVEGFFHHLRRQFQDISSYFVFDPAKRSQRQINFLFDIFDDGVYLLHTAELSEAKKRFELFRSLAQTFFHDEALRQDLKKRFLAFQIFFPQERSLFEIRRTVNAALLDASVFDRTFFEENQAIVRSALFDAFSSVSFDPFLAQELLNEYFQSFARILDADQLDMLADTAFYQSRLSDEEGILTAFLQSSPAFYKDYFFAEKEKLDFLYLSVFTGGEQADLPKLQVVSWNQDLLRRLRLYLFSEKISVNDARPIAFRLGKHVLTQEEFLRYLQSDFPTSSLYGSTQKERFIAYQQSRQELKEFAQIRETFAGVPSEKDMKEREDILREVQVLFAANGIQDVVVGSIFDTEQRFIPIEKAVFNDIEFSAIYDLDQQLISEIEVGGDLILESAIKLDKIATLLKPATEQESTPSLPSLNGSIETKSEKVAKLLLAQKLHELAFQLDVSQIQTLNFSRKQFHIFAALLPHGKENIFVNFRFDMMRNQASAIVVKTLKGPREMNRTIAAPELASKLREFYDQMFFEQVEKELEVASPRL